MVRQKASPLQFVAYRSMSGRNFHEILRVPRTLKIVHVLRYQIFETVPLMTNLGPTLF